MSNNDAPVLCDRGEGGIATVTINNPSRRNALDLNTWRLLEQTMNELSADDDLRCVIVRGAGEKAFAAGADIKEFQRERRNAEEAIDLRGIGTIRCSHQPDWPRFCLPRGGTGHASCRTTAYSGDAL